MMGFSEAMVRMPCSRVTLAMARIIGTGPAVIDRFTGYAGSAIRSASFPVTKPL